MSDPQPPHVLQPSRHLRSWDFPGKSTGVGCHCLLRKEDLSSVQFSFSVVSNSLRLMNRSMPGLPVHHQLPEFTQTHVHRISDAIQPSHPLSSPSPPAPNPSQDQSPFQEDLVLAKKKKKILPEKPVRSHGKQDKKKNETSLGLISCKSWRGKLQPVFTGNLGYKLCLKHAPTQGYGAGISLSH